MRVWCLGNVLLGDDAAGCRVAELLLEKKFTCVTDCGTTPENHIASLRRSPASPLLIVDAADMGLPPGELRRLSLKELDAAAGTSHGIPIALLLSPFADVFEISVLGIQPMPVRLGAALSEPVEKAARLAAEMIAHGEWEKVPALYP